MKLYVGNLPYTVTDEQLSEIFSEYGDVESASLIVDKFSNQSKGFGFVEMPSNASADAAIKALNESQMGGRRIKVNEAKPKSNSRR